MYPFTDEVLNLIAVGLYSKIPLIVTKTMSIFNKIQSCKVLL
jgi:hypothetical protein